MADFTSVGGIFTNITAAQDILRIFKNIYGACLEVEAILARYNTDAAFKAEADHLYTAEQLGEIGNMITEIQTLRAGWANDHQGPLNLIPPAGPGGLP